MLERASPGMLETLLVVIDERHKAQERAQKQADRQARKRR